MKQQEIETHPFEPFLPCNAKLLMLGTFPPASHRWSMEFYYPNFQNDMWRIFGWIFYGDKNHFIVPGEKTFRLDELKDFLSAQGIALYDTAKRVIRTKGTASDKDLKIVEPADLEALLAALPECRGVLTAGQLATEVFAAHFGIAVKELKMGESMPFVWQDRQMRLYRMPSSSRAYPMSVEKKADAYARMLRDLHIISDD